MGPLTEKIELGYQAWEITPWWVASAVKERKFIDGLSIDALFVDELIMDLVFIVSSVRV